MHFPNVWCVRTLCVLLALAVAPQCVASTEVKVRTTLSKGVNGGTSCAACSAIVALVEQTSEFHNESVARAMERICLLLPDPDKYQRFCKEFVDAVGPALIVLLAEDASPDRACHALGLCVTDPGRQTCVSIPESPALRAKFDERVKRGRQTVSHLDPAGLFRVGADICDLPGIKELCQLIDRIFDSHLPAEDLDKDSYSVFTTLRGSAWRGKDCDDFDSTIHPGALPRNGDVSFDSNCNGIHGVNPQTQTSYEDELCGGTSPRGVAVLGDSISAHFHLPENWLDATQLSLAAFEHLEFILENELDWPELSSATGLGFNNWTEVIQGPMDSVYLRLRNRNRCNHKDYQNIAVNGADSHSMDQPIMESLARNQGQDRPLVVFYALIGNDVCNGHVDDTFSHMTTPAEMRANVLKTLQYLDTRLPANSTVFLVGLADGRVLYDSLKDRIHPLGRFWNKFTYSDFYDFFNCLQVTPCSGWMNTNETIRNLTTQRAEELSAQLEDVAKKNQTNYKHFNVYYMENPIPEVLKSWKAQGGEAWQLLEPVDGFHTNQYGQSLTAGAIWEQAEKIVPGVFGPANPNNQKIDQLFHDQGPYF